MSQVTSKKYIPENTYLDPAATPWQKLHVHLLCERNNYDLLMSTRLRFKKRYFSYSNTNRLSISYCKGSGLRNPKIYRTGENIKFTIQSYEWWVNRLIYKDPYTEITDSWLDEQIKTLNHD